MKNLMQKVQSFWHEEDGLVAIEYGLIATLVALAIITGATALGEGLDTMFGGIAECFASPPAGIYCAAPPAG